ncbi:MAG: sodium:solute symporter [Planctomycetota bacterium]
MAIAPLDLVLLVAYLAATIAFGLWMGRGQKTANDYLLGGRDLPWWALLLSIVATETSTATFLSVPGLAYSAQFGTGDLRFLQLPLGYLVGRTVATFLLVPLYFRGELFTAYDVLRVRSGPAVRTLASGLFLVTRTLADGLRLYLTAVVLQVMFGWSLGLSVAITGLGTVAYTVVGGIKAVVWTDVLQFGVYMVGALAALLVIGSSVDGGLGVVFANASEQGRLRVFDFGLDFGATYTFWAGLLGGAVLSIGSHGVDQMIVQRYLSARSQRDAQKALFWSGPLVLAQFAVFLAIGLGLSAFYAAHPPATAFGKGDHVFADFIVHHLPQGLVGLVLGAVFAAAMSTLSSSLSASASALVNDFLLPATGQRPDGAFALRAAKAATLLFAGLQIAVGVSGLGGGKAVVDSVLAIATVTTGVILGLFVLALLPTRSATTSLVGLCGGLGAIVGVVFVLPAIDLAPEPGVQPFRLAWPWHGLVSSGATVLVGWLATMVANALAALRRRG